MRTIKTYFKGAPFYNAFIRPYPERADNLNSLAHKFLHVNQP
jgi:hypothetical protein